MSFIFLIKKDVKSSFETKKESGGMGGRSHIINDREDNWKHVKNCSVVPEIQPRLEIWNSELDQWYRCFSKNFQRPWGVMEKIDI